MRNRSKRKSRRNGFKRYLTTKLTRGGYRLT